MTRRIWSITAFNGALLALIVLHGNIIVSGNKADASAHNQVPVVVQVQASSAAAVDHEAPRRRVRPIRKAPTLLPVVMQKDITSAHQKLADEVLRAIHPGCRESLQNFYVRYDNPENRGLAGGTTIILTGNVEADEFRGLLIHECGHLIDLTALTGTAKSGPTAFMDGNVVMYRDDPSVDFYTISWTDSETRSRNSKDSDFVSGYATHDVFEDFAETFTYYMLQRDAFKTRAQTNAALKAKFNWMETNIGMPEVGLGSPASKTIPWDTTRVPYTWFGQIKVTQR